MNDDTLLAVIDNFLLKYGFAPTVRELAECMGGCSPSTIQGGLERLREQGRVHWYPGLARTLSLVKTNE